MAGVLRHAVINHDRFAASYGDNYSAYREVMREAEAAAKAHGRRLGIPRTTVERWLAGSNRPKSVEGVERVSHLLPLTYDHKHFPAVNKLAAWALFSGSIDRSHNFALQHKPEGLGPAKKLLDSIGVKYYERKGGGHIQSSKSGAAFGRLLHLLGVPKAERKAVTDLHLPKYMRELTSIVEGGRLAGREEETARGHVRDFVEVLKHTRMQGERRAAYIPLPRNRSEERARAFGEEVLRTVRLVHPKATLSLYRKKASYEARIRLPRE